MLARQSRSACRLATRNYYNEAGKDVKVAEHERFIHKVRMISQDPSYPSDYFSIFYQRLRLNDSWLIA